LKYLDIPALSRLAGQAPQHIKTQIYFCANPWHALPVMISSSWGLLTGAVLGAAAVQGELPAKFRKNCCF
jgi:predicted Na+-dependent transporter